MLRAGEIANTNGDSSSPCNRAPPKTGDRPSNHLEVSQDDAGVKPVACSTRSVMFWLGSRPPMGGCCAKWKLRHVREATSTGALHMNGTGGCISCGTLNSQPDEEPRLLPPGWCIVYLQDSSAGSARELPADDHRPRVEPPRELPTCGGTLRFTLDVSLA